MTANEGELERDNGEKEEERNRRVIYNYPPVVDSTFAILFVG